MSALIVTAGRLVVPGKGLLAADESPATIGRRFAAVGVENTEEHRRAYRQMLLTTKGTAAFISGVILHDETIRQNTDDGTPLARLLEREGMIVGIKVDEGAKPLAGSPGELVTEGLDGLRARLVGYRQLGAQFAKWRAVIQIAPGLPTPTCVEANAEALARYAALCQETASCRSWSPRCCSTAITRSSAASRSPRRYSTPCSPRSTVTTWTSKRRC